MSAGSGFPETLVLDGGLATELERHSCDIAGPLWSARALLERPDAIAAVHLDYLRAGAECITTASYQVSFEGFAEAGLSVDDVIDALKTSREVANQARAAFARDTGQRAWIAASVGPYGAILHDGAEYHGRYHISFEALVAFHRSRLPHLIGPGIDLLACETIPSLEEARAILAAIADFPDIAAWFAFTCADGHHTAHGEPIADCARLLDACPQVVAIGVNCTSPAFIPSLIGHLRSSTRKPIVVYPNSGERWDAQARRWIGESGAAMYGALARSWHDHGARWIGGCCRTTPAHISQVRTVLKSALDG